MDYIQGRKLIPPHCNLTEEEFFNLVRQRELKPYIEYHYQEFPGVPPLFDPEMVPLFPIPAIKQKHVLLEHLLERIQAAQEQQGKTDEQLIEEGRWRWQRDAESERKEMGGYPVRPELQNHSLINTIEDFKKTYGLDGIRKIRERDTATIRDIPAQIEQLEKELALL